MTSNVQASVPSNMYKLFPKMA